MGDTEGTSGQQAVTRELWPNAYWCRHNRCDRLASYMFTFHLHMLEQPCIEGFVPLALCEDHIYAVESLDILYLASVKLADDLINDANEQKDKVEYVNQRLIIEAIAINNPTLQSAILAVFDSASGTERYIQEKISEL